jgi:hypothetical protein
MAIGAAGIGPHERHGRRAIERVDRRVLINIGDAGEHTDLEVAPDHRGHAQQLPGAVAQARNALDDHFPDIRRHAHLRVADPYPTVAFTGTDDPSLGEMAQHLADEERVPVGLAR